MVVVINLNNKIRINIFSFYIILIGKEEIPKFNQIYYIWFSNSSIKEQLKFLFTIFFWLVNFFSTSSLWQGNKSPAIKLRRAFQKGIFWYSFYRCEIFLEIGAIEWSASYMQIHIIYYLFGTFWCRDRMHVFPIFRIPFLFSGYWYPEEWSSAWKKERRISGFARLLFLLLGLLSSFSRFLSSTFFPLSQLHPPLFDSSFLFFPLYLFFIKNLFIPLLAHFIYICICI